MASKNGARTRIATAVFSLALLAGSGALAPAPCGAQLASRMPPKANGFLTITPQQAKVLLDARPEVVLIDVRSPEEYYQGALPGSTLVPFWDAMKGKILLPKETPLLLVCAVGGRSLAVGRYLAMQGFREVYNLKGGLEAWVEQRVPLPARGRKG